MNPPLIALVVIVLEFAALTVEVVVYLCNARCVFAAGPVVLRQRWQTRMTASQAAAALEEALRTAKLAWRRHGDLFAVRRPWWEFSTYPRITLRLESASEGTAIAYEVKPFVTGALFAIPIPAMLGSANRVDALLWYAMSAFVIAGYAYFFAWEVKRLHGMDIVRQRLAAAGVRVCPKCGYDLFGLEEAARCPECGTANG